MVSATLRNYCTAASESDAQRLNALRHADPTYEKFVPLGVTIYRKVRKQSVFPDLVVPSGGDNAEPVAASTRDMFSMLR